MFAQQHLSAYPEGLLVVVDALKAVAIAVATLIGVIAAIAQIVDYLATGKLDFLLISIAVILFAVPIAVAVIIWVRGGPGSTFSWNTFRAVAATSASVAALTLGTAAVVLIAGAVSLTSSPPPTSPAPFPAPPSTVASPVALPPRTSCPPAGESGARAVSPTSQVEAGYVLQPGPAHYKMVLADKIHLEVGGQLLGSIPAEKQIFLLTWADPATRDSTPKRNRGNGLYYRMDTFRIVGSCYIRPQDEIAYSGANGLTFRQQLVLVDVEQVPAFRAPQYDEGYDDAALDSFGVIRLAYFDVPTADLQ
jgi:hypothetical protein